MIYKSVPTRVGIVAGTNFFSTFTPVFYCAFCALLIDRFLPIASRQALNVLLVAALYTFPLVLTGIFTQFLNTRYSSRNVILFCKMCETLLGVLGIGAVALFPVAGYIPMLAVVVLLGVEYSFYRSALKIYTADSLPKKVLSHVSGITEANTFFGIVLGTVCAVLVHNFIPGHIWPAGLTAIFGAFGMIVASRMEPVAAHKRKLRFSELPRQWLNSLREQPRYRELVLTGIGESYIFGSIILVASMAIQYIDLHFQGNGDSQLYVYSIIASVVIGAGIGCLLGARLSHGNVEVGLVPTYTSGMVLVLLLIGTVPYYADFFVESGLLTVLLFLFGVCAGIVLVPMQSYQQYFVKRELTPAFFCWFYVPFGLGILLAIGLAALMYYYGTSIFSVTLALAVLSTALGLTTCAIMPQFLLRMFMQILTSTFYRLRVFNADRIPEDGPVLIVANRASFVDILFISSCTSRPIRFVTHESYFRYSWLNWLFRAVGFIEVPANKPKRLRRFFETTKELFRKGELICVFPEEDITRNGTMSGFRDGMAAMLPDDLEVPILPVRIGMTWGSIFSCYYGSFTLRWPNEIPHPASVTVGKPIPRETPAYEIRIILSELAAETELIPSPEELPFHSRFALVTRRRPLVSTIRQFNGEEWEQPSNFQMLVRAALVSRYLRRICDDGEEYVGLMLPNGIAALSMMLGILMADRKVAILNYTAGKEANLHAVKVAKLRHIITSREFLEKIHFEPLEEMIFLEDVKGKIARPWNKFLWSLGAILLPSCEFMKFLSPESWNDVNRVAVLIFSSGSTGIPKGIMLTHHNINADVSAVTSVIGWTKSDRVLGNLPMFHSFGLTVCIWMPIVTGAQTVLIPNALDGNAATRALRERKITLLSCTPGFLQLYMRRGKAEDFKSLRLVITGAEKLRDDVAEKFFNLTGLTIAEGYGCTELSPVVSINMAKTLKELGLAVEEPGSIGPPLPGVCAKVVDPSTFELLPDNTDGLLIVKGAIVMAGYLGAPEKTAEVIRDGWYITGDIAKMNRNGFITITGRLSRFSKVAGEMVPHELVEREINNILHPEDRLVAVCGCSDQRRGEKLLVFYTDRERLAPEELVKRLRGSGIPNLWIPKSENFIHVDHLPMLGSGKLDLAALSKMAQQYGD